MGGYTQTDNVAAAQDEVLDEHAGRSQSDPAIDVRDLTKSYGKVSAVDSISFQVLPGEIFGLVGLNGAGKTTTVMMLSSLLNPDCGSATVYGHDIVTDKGGVRESIGLVFEEEAVDIYLTGKENLDFAARMYSLPKRVREERVADVLKTVGLEPHANTEVRNYSGGMLRRLEIARGMLTSPEILFLDEPTIGLDVQTRRYLWDYIKRLNTEKGTTVLLSTSYLDEADYLCNRIAIMDEGRILVIGAPDQLKASVGKQVITLKLSNGSDEQFVQRLRSLGWVKDVKRSNSSLVLSTEDRNIGTLEIVRLATEQGVGVSSVKSLRPNLDDVLLHYTGKRTNEVGGR